MHRGLLGGVARYCPVGCLISAVAGSAGLESRLVPPSRSASGQFASRTGSSSCRCAPTLRPAAGRPGRCAGQPATDRRASPATDPARRGGPGGQLACSGRLMNPRSAGSWNHRMMTLMSAGWLVPQLGDVLVPLPGREATGCGTDPPDGVLDVQVPEPRCAVGAATGQHAATRAECHRVHGAGAAFRPELAGAACVIGRRWAAVHPGRNASSLPLSAARHRHRVLRTD